MKQARGIIFDKDGTLFDFAATWEQWAATVLRKLAADETHAEVLAHAVGFDLKTLTFQPDSIVIANTPEEISQALGVHLPELSVPEITDILNTEAEDAPQVEVVPLVALMSELKDAGLILGVVTNDAERPALKHLESVSILTCFAFIAGSDSGFGAKPAPGQLNAFAQATGLSPDECVMVGDSPHDLIAGSRAGMRCVGVLTGGAQAETLAPHADVVLRDIGQLPRWLADQASKA